MARIGLGVAGLVFLVAAATATVCTAQTTPVVQPMAMPTCAPVPISLSPCIGYVFGVGSASLPSCCSQLQAFFKSQGPCLCAMSKLAPSPFGLVLGQVQGMIPNVCNLPTDPCDDLFGASASTSPDDSTNATATSATAPATAPVAEPATTTSTDADAAPGDDSPAVATAPGQVAPQGAGSKDSQGTSKFPELLHAAGARSSAAGTVLISVLLAYVSAMFV
uniref:Uncharacterized protein n=1 Tax=Avena sativa TaxID=4498 RepID=A0ACD6A633_AVESA